MPFWALNTDRAMVRGPVATSTAPPVIPDVAVVMGAPAVTAMLMPVLATCPAPPMAAWAVLAVPEPAAYPAPRAWRACCLALDVSPRFLAALAAFASFTVL